jgi:hypothetical protein
VERATGRAIDRAQERTPEQRIGRAAVVGGVVGTAVLLPAFVALGLAVGAGAAAAVGIALYCAVLGGLGLGCMWGAVLAFDKEARREVKAGRS